MLDFLFLAMTIGLAMLIWDCIEVGRNDAANLVNAVFGARVLKRRVAVSLAAAAVVMGATFASPVVETARKGIFDPSELTVRMALSIYVSVYFVDTVLLYGFSGFGMPVSTTACLVFELVGAAMFLAGFDNIQWSNMSSVLTAIIVSIIVSGVASFMVMRVFRGVVRNRVQDPETIRVHGPWISGAILTWLTWFMIFKGLVGVKVVQQIKEILFDSYGLAPVLLFMWAGFSAVVHLILWLTRGTGHKHLFSFTAVLGMICMAFAFGQNDLANAASPGLAGWTLWNSGSGPEDLASLATKVPIPTWALFGCGLLMALGMFTDYAQRVTRAEVNTGSQCDHVSLYAPRWCVWIARQFVRKDAPPGSQNHAEAPIVNGKQAHYDTLRASVITGVSASVIASASGLGLPVSTTYVAFAAVLGSGFADRVFVHGDADRKVGRAIWVISCWFLSPLIAVIATGCVATLVYQLSAIGLFVCIGLNLYVRLLFKRRADAHERKYHASDEDDEAREVPQARD